MKISYNDLFSKFKEILVKRGLDKVRAEETAKIFASNSLDGVYSHGVNRFPKMIELIDKGYIDVKGQAERFKGQGPYEIWDGNLGLGVLNAKISMGRAIDLSKKHGIGLVSLKNTSHWMRAGSYGLQAADAGCIGICWTNTLANMPPWGGKDNRIGNNPLVISIPRTNGNHVLVDMAMSQFSYGKIEEYKLAGKKLPMDGGYDKEGNLTDIPEHIGNTRRILPTGYWKGSSLSIALDLLVAILSRGDSIADLCKKSDIEFGVSQIFIAINPLMYNSQESIDKTIDDTIAFIKSSEPIDENINIRYPGENLEQIRNENLENGIPVADSVWEKINSL